MWCTVCVDHSYMQHLSTSDTFTKTSQTFKLSIFVQSRNNTVALYLSRSSYSQWTDCVQFVFHDVVFCHFILWVNFYLHSRFVHLFSIFCVLTNHFSDYCCVYFSAYSSVLFCKLLIVVINLSVKAALHQHLVSASSIKYWSNVQTVFTA